MSNIILSVKREAWRKDNAYAMDTEFQAQRKEVKNRDGDSCVFCGFHSPKYQEVHHMNDDHTDNSPENLITACPLCHACFHIGLAGTQGRGMIIYYPEVTQEELNRVVRTLMICMEHDRYEQFSIAALGYFESLVNRIEPVKEYFHEDWCDASKLGSVLKQLNDDDYADRDKALSGLRLLAVPDGYTDHIHYWGDELYKTMPPEAWANSAGLASL